MTDRKIVINSLPSPTWNRLKINDAIVTLPDNIRNGVACVELSPDIVCYDADFPSEIQTGMGTDIDGFFRLASTNGFIVNSGTPTPVKLEYKETDTVCSEYFEVEDGASLNVIQTFSLSEPGNLFDRIVFRIKKHAKVTLTQIFCGESSSETLSAVGSLVDEGACFNVIQIFLNGRNYSGLQSELIGDGSSFSADCAYNVGTNEILDINYNIIHFGKQTNCDIKTAGTLYGNAEKVFRGTIDFRRGSSGSTGSELEDVMLLSDDVINKTIPVILCKEEDVEGNHGATIGEIPEELLFYLMSRGLSAEEISEMLARARLERVIHLIPDKHTQCSLLK